MERAEPLRDLGAAPVREEDVGEQERDLPECVVATRIAAAGSLASRTT